MELLDISITIISSIIITFLLTYYFVAIKNKEIKCVYIPHFSLLEINEQIKNSTEVKYNNLRVKNLLSIIIKIVNTGYKSVSTMESFKIRFDKNLKIIDHIELDKSPYNFIHNVETNKEHENESFISFDLLNKKNYFIIQYILTGDGTDKFEICDEKIADINKIKFKKGILLGEKENRNNMIQYGIGQMMGGFIFLGLSMFLFNDLSLKFSVGGEWIFPLIAMLFLICFGGYMVALGFTELQNYRIYTIKKELLEENL